MLVTGCMWPSATTAQKMRRSLVIFYISRRLLNPLPFRSSVRRTPAHFSLRLCTFSKGSQLNTRRHERTTAHLMLHWLAVTFSNARRATHCSGECQLLCHAPDALLLAWLISHPPASASPLLSPILLVFRYFHD